MNKTALSPECKYQRESQDREFPYCTLDEKCDGNFQRAYDNETGVFCGKRFFINMFTELVTEDLPDGWGMR